MLRFAAAALCALAMSSPAGADDASARKKCLNEHRWCWSEATDPITRQTSATASVISTDKLRFNSQHARVMIMVTCGSGKVATFVIAGATISYLPLGVRYRIDPGGVLGAGEATHIQSGKVFMLPDTFIDVALLGDDLTAEFMVKGDRTASVAKFNIKGLPDVVRRLDCQKPKR